METFTAVMQTMTNLRTAIGALSRIAEHDSEDGLMARHALYRIGGSESREWYRFDGGGSVEPAVQAL